MKLFPNTGLFCKQDIFLRFDGESEGLNQISLQGTKVFSPLIINPSINKFSSVRD